MLFISIFLTKACKKKKLIASSIQLAFDTYVFSMPWDVKLFGQQKNLNADIIEKSQRILNDENEKNKLKDWYTPFIDKLTLEEGIFACQKENYHWDAGLRKRYRRFAITIIAVLTVTIFIIGIIKNEPFQELVTRCIFVLPMARWLVSTISGLNEDLERLNELDGKFTLTRNKTMEELQIIQKSITDHRKAAIKIPNIVYRMFKDNDEDREHRIATMDAEL